MGIGRWLKKGTWTLLDRGLFSISNFVLNVLLARWLTPKDYGIFTLIYALFWLVGAFHTALLVEPLLVFGPGHYRNRLPDYFGALLYAHFSLVIPISLLLVLASFGVGVSGDYSLLKPLIGIALSGPFILFLWLMRQACYVRVEPELATLAGMLYAILMLVGIYAMHQHEWLSATAAFGVMGTSSLLVALGLTTCLRVDLYHSVESGLIREVWRRHWHFGRWSAATQALMIAPENIYYLALTAWWGLEATATLKALRNLNMPIARVNVALSSLLVPNLVKVRGQPQFMHIVRVALVCFVLGPMLSWILVGVFHQPAVAWLYKGNYQEYAGLIWILGIGPVCGGVVVVLNSTLRSLELPQEVFRAFCMLTPATLAITLGLIITKGIIGAVLGLAIASVLEAGVVALIFLKSYWKAPSI